MHDSATLTRHRFATPQCALRVGVLLPPGPSVPRWAQAAIEALSQEAALRLSLIRLSEGSGGSRANPSMLAEMLQRMERLNRKGRDPFARGDVPQIAGGTLVEVSMDETGALSASAREFLGALQLDVLIWLGELPLEVDCADQARLGLWFFHFGDVRRPLIQPLYWREIADNEQVSIVCLQRMADGAAESIAEIALPTVAGWAFTQNGEAPFAMAAHLLVHALLDAAHDESRFLARLHSSPPTHPPDPPSVRRIARFLGDRLKQSLAGRITRRDRGLGEDWFVAIRHARGLSARDIASGGFVDVPMPKGVQYADPFLFESGGRHWLFVEEIPGYGQNGRITCLEIHEDLSVGEPVVVLEKPYHLSYPVVLEHSNKCFLMPESGADGTVQLYASTCFPYEWKLETILCEGLPFLDTTPFLLDGVWYFFTTVHDRAPETFLFTAESLQGPWHYHPANPICSDSHRARGAGAVFRQNGSLFRPSQDCSVRYGYAIVFNEILRLTPTEYLERPGETVVPDWRPGLLSTHTLNSNGTYEVIDGTRKVAR